MFWNNKIDLSKIESDIDFIIDDLTYMKANLKTILDALEKLQPDVISVDKEIEGTKNG